MQKIISKRTIIKTIEEEVEIPIYIANDGTIFDNENECIKYDDKIDFLLYFEKKYNLENIDIQDYGINFGDVLFCHIVFIEKINDTVIDDFIRYYSLEDHPDDIIKLKSGWSFVALINDESLWIQDKSNRLFIIESVDDVITKKKNEINNLKKLIFC